MAVMEAKTSEHTAGSRLWAESRPTRATEVRFHFSSKFRHKVHFAFTSFAGYKGQDGFCHAHEPNVTLVAPINGWVNVTSGDPNAMRLAVFQHGPISVAIDASHKTFSFYSNGVYYEPAWLVDRRRLPQMHTMFTL